MSINVQDFLATVKNRWAQRGLGVIPISQGKPIERTQRPYAVVDNVVQTPMTRTTQSRVDTYRFTIHACHNTSEEVGALAKQIEDALLWAPLTVAGGSVLEVGRPVIRYLEEDYYQKAVLDFPATVKQSANADPA